MLDLEYLRHWADELRGRDLLERALSEGDLDDSTGAPD
jgi:hypothetical protein